MEGCGFRRIGRLLGISHVIVFYWVKKWGQDVTIPAPSRELKVVELDELHPYVGSKKSRWIWIAVARFGKRFVSFVCGDRSTRTELKLWEQLNLLKIHNFALDSWKSYEHFIPKEKHLQTKAETFTVECYSHANHMLVLSLKLLFLKINNELAILN